MHPVQEKYVLLRGEYGAKFHTPPTPEKTLLGVGGGCIKRGGVIKFLLRGASKYTPPPPSPERCLMARNGGRGGVYNFVLEGKNLGHNNWEVVRAAVEKGIAFVYRLEFIELCRDSPIKLPSGGDRAAGGATGIPWGCCGVRN